MRTENYSGSVNVSKRCAYLGVKIGSETCLATLLGMITPSVDVTPLTEVTSCEWRTDASTRVGVTDPSRQLTQVTF